MPNDETGLENLKEKWKTRSSMIVYIHIMIDLCVSFVCNIFGIIR